MSSTVRSAPVRIINRRWVIAVGVFLALALAASLVVFGAVRNLVRGLPFELAAERPEVNVPGTPGVPDPAAIPTWTGTDRVNVLLLGIDEREKQDGPWRTDTMILLTIDPATRSAGLLSIPRDLWVPIYGYDTEGKINTAHFIGDLNHYPGGGPALAMATVQDNFGVPVHYYVRLNFTAFEQLIDRIGGIEICVDQTIDDPQYPDSGVGYEPLHIEAGCQHMDGRLALKYARTRHTEMGDFDRARRQQQVIKAVRDRITQAGMLPTLVGQAGPLLDALGNSIDTNFTLDEMIRLADLATHIDPASIQSFVIEPSMTLPYMAPTDPPQAVLVPIRDEVRQLRDRFLSSGLPATPVPAGADAATRLATEAAAIRVENGTLSVGLAARTRDYLAQRGFRIESFGDAFDGRTDHVTTIIIDYAGKPFTASHIAAALGVPDASVQSAAANGDGIDVRVVLGNDYAAGLGSQLLLTPVPTP